ncbi:MAG: vesicle coat component [Trichoglossum hirsutum]|nr:MAG: vesicle coat component [Trichoglossum hirsutum]
MSNSVPGVNGESQQRDDSPADLGVDLSSMTTNISSMSGKRDLPSSPKQEETIAGLDHRSNTAFTAAALPEFIGSRSISPLQCGAQSGNDVGSHSTSSQERNPPQGLGHSSSESFARTVSHEITWAQDEFIDPAWGLSRKESDPFKFMGENDRTNSFPDVPPVHHPIPSPDKHVLSHSTVDEKVDGMGDSVYSLADNDEHRGYSYLEIQQEAHAKESSTVFAEENDDGLDFFDGFGKSQGGNIPAPPDYEARYEGGVPLVQPLSHTRQEGSSETLQQPNPSSPFGDSPESHDDDFFNNSSADPQSQQPFSPPLDRKSTTQVLNSLDFASREGDRDERRLGISEGGELSTSLVSSGAHTHARTAGDATEDVAVHEPATQNIDGAEPNTPSLEGKSRKDDELAAMWEAVLDDDELLDDDEPTIDPSGFFDGEEGRFLEDEVPTTSLNGTTEDVRPHSSDLAIGDTGTFRGFHSVNAGNMQQNMSERNSPPPADTPQQEQQSRPLPTPANPYLPTKQQRPQLPTQQSHEMPQSFSDKSKGGYSSPYDLPVDIRPRKRTSMQQISTGIVGQGPAQQPPPRSSSIYASQPPGVFPRPAASLPTASAPSPSPPMPSQSFQPSTGPQLATSADSALPPAAARPNSSSFFEELPMTSKPRHSGGNRYTPQPAGIPPPHTSQQGYAQAPQAPTSVSYVAPPAQQLLPPERVGPFAVPSHPTSLPPPTARYSPVPPLRSGNVQGQGKYAALPASAPPSAVASLPHQPRIGSPLAHYEVQHQDQPHPKSAVIPSSISQKQEAHGRPSSQGTTARNVSNLGGAPREEEEMSFERELSQREGSDSRPQPHHWTPTSGASISRKTLSTPPPPKALPSQTTSSPSKRTTNYSPQYHPSVPIAEPPFAPPRRAQTQSPGAAAAGPKLSTMPRDPYQRPSSAHGTVSTTIPSSYAAVSEPVPVDRTRQLSSNLSYITPADGREVDPLQRWKGCPIFVWGFGGTIVTSFPKEIPRYSSGHTQPLMVCSPGEVIVKSAKDVLPLEDRFAGFPGPLRTKGKKKETLSWLTENIELQEREASELGYEPITAEARKRYEEKLLLWKILRVLVEKDGVLEGSIEVEKAVRATLMPETQTDREDSQSQYGGTLANIAQSVNAKLQPDSVDPEMLETLRKDLLKGDREKAVWHAVDKRLWGHAMLISSTLNRDTWKQVVQEFVRQEVKNLGSNTESLAALYEIFAGNVEESVDELVPPSARAGLQMVSTSVNTGPTKNALEGLDRWKETLGLVLSNRSTDDERALLSLGRLLAGYGRVEAAHLCYLFVRSHPAFGGADDPQTSFTLLGADHARQPANFANNLESILLSEIYEFAAILNPSGHGSPSPHLQAYKLYHASILADYGYRSEAQNYCAAITNGIRSTTKSSPYYHSGLFSILDDLSNRLQQSPKDYSGSWISKPSMEKVSGSMWAKFNSFVAGDDSDAASTGSSKDVPEIGPFSKIAGGTPSLSRTGSAADLYGAAYTSRELGPPTSGPTSSFETSRYAPRVAYEPQGPPSYDMQSTSSQELRTSMESQSSSYDTRRPADIAHGAHDMLQNGTFESAKPQSLYQAVSQPAQYGTPPQQPSLYPPRSALAQNPYAVTSSDAVSSHYSSIVSPQKPSPPSDSSRSYQGYEPQHSSGHQTPNSTEIEESSSYEPPSYSSYEPPESSAPYNEAGSGEASPVQEKPKKRSFYDDGDDDDLTARAAEIAKQERKSREKESKEKAAAPNGKQDTSGEKKSGWFGGWFGKKDSNALAGPIRAKLGEESSFYYDPEQKRWVNKKAGDTTSAPAATPPPPRNPTPRSFSGPPSSTSASKSMPAAPQVSTSSPPPSLAASAPPASLNGLRPPHDAPPPSRSPSISGTPPRTDSPLSGGYGASLAPPTLFSSSADPASGPPSRPSTALSNASSIDDLIGPPGAARKGGTIKKNKAKRGYVDVMAK